MILTEGIADSRLLRASIPFTTRVTGNQALEATIAENFVHNPTVAFFRAYDLKQAQYVNERSGDLVAPEEANRRYGELGLSFDSPVGEDALSIIVRRKREELKRQSILARSPNIGVQQFLTGLAVTAIDPLNVAAAFIPVVGEARYASWAARFGKNAARFGRGSIEGAVGAAALEPVILAAAEAEQSNYDAVDSLLNVAFGTILGGGLHAGFGKVSDMMNRATFETREAALRSSVAQMAEGRPVDISPVIRSDTATHPSAEPLAAVKDAVDRMDRASARLEEARTAERALAARQEELSALTIEAGQVNALGRGESPELISRQLDDVTGQRLQDIEAELGTEISAVRRQALERERDVIRESIADEIPLAQERAKAEARGISAERDRVAADVRRLEAEVEAGRGDVEKASKAMAKADRRFRELIEREGLEPAVAARAVDEAVRLETRQAGQRATREARERPQAPDPILGESASRRADEVAARDDNDLDAELEEIDEVLNGYIEQGALPESVRTGIDDDVAEATRIGNAARAAARCLLLHP